jgi:hypothetical protein
MRSDREPVQPRERMAAVRRRCWSRSRRLWLRALRLTAPVQASRARPAVLSGRSCSRVLEMARPAIGEGQPPGEKVRAGVAWDRAGLLTGGWPEPALALTVRDRPVLPLGAVAGLFRAGAGRCRPIPGLIQAMATPVRIAGWAGQASSPAQVRPSPSSSNECPAVPLLPPMRLAAPPERYVNFWE